MSSVLHRLLTMNDLTADQRLARFARATEHAWQAHLALDRARSDDADARVELAAARAALSREEEKRADDAIAFYYADIRVTTKR